MNVFTERRVVGGSDPTVLAEIEIPRLWVQHRSDNAFAVAGRTVADGAGQLKEMLAETMLENRLLKKSVIMDGEENI